MSTTLEIKDGSHYWWNSTDIWVVPGADPNGSPGQPVAGEAAYLWARVHNTGDTAAYGAQVNFYWSNPATGVLRSNSTLIGSAFVDLEQNDVQDVLCLIPWIPTIVNDGHECVVAEVIHSLDPLPNPLPDEFDPSNYHQIAQRNLTVLEMKTSMKMMTIQLAAPPRKERLLELAVEIGGDLDKAALASFGLSRFKPATKPAVEVSLSEDRDCDESSGKKQGDRLKVLVKPGTARAVYLKVFPRDLFPGVYQPINVVAYESDRIIGGVTYIAISREDA